MAGPGFQDLRSGLRARDISSESNHELSEALQSGPDPVAKKITLLQKKIITLRSQEKPEVRFDHDLFRKLVGGEAEIAEDESVAIYSARSSFSQALKECQDRRLRSRVLSKYSDRQRPVSLDLNNTVIDSVNSPSPSFGVMKKPPVPTCRIAIFPSPGTPNNQHMNGIQKGWNSERIPLQHTNANERKVNAGLLPFNNRKVALPSKWEDAERWIFTPVVSDGTVRAFQQPQRRPKSKSGPLGSPGAAYFRMLAPNSPCPAGVMTVDGSSTQYRGRERSGNFLVCTEPCMARSISIHGCSETLCQSSLPEDKKYNCAEDAADNISHVVLRRDRATQMSPESSIRSSSRRLSSNSLATPSIQPIVESQTMQFAKPEIRDVPVDERVTMTRWSKKNRDKTQSTYENADDWKRKAANIHSGSWEISEETSKSISKDETKISSWENLQRAKAEAKIRKLEMKLEKKRSSSMEKIMNKLRSAQRKAQEMRSSMATGNEATHQTTRPFEKALSYRRARQIGCFMCPAF